MHVQCKTKSPSVKRYHYCGTYPTTKGRPFGVIPANRGSNNAGANAADCSHPIPTPIAILLATPRCAGCRSPPSGYTRGIGTLCGLDLPLALGKLPHLGQLRCAGRCEQNFHLTRGAARPKDAFLIAGQPLFLYLSPKDPLSRNCLNTELG